MQTSQGQSDPATRLPGRVVIRLPELTIISTGIDDDDHWIGDLATSLFSQEVIEIIADDVLPSLLDNEVWSGELAPHDAVVPLVEVDTELTDDTTPDDAASQADERVDPARSDNDDDLTNEAVAGPVAAITLWVPHQVAETAPSHATLLIGTTAASSTTGVARDPLTGLPTRLVLLDRLDVARRRSRRNDDLLATLFVDLDGLKAINDRFGHEQGDAALRAAASRIRSCLREGDTVARFGGDEFVVLCESLEHEQQAERVAQRMLQTLTTADRRPISASIGIAYDRGGRIGALDLIGRADAAMYRAKAAGGSRYEVFDREMQGRMAADQSLRARLLETLEHDAFDVAAQPLFQLQTGQTLGVELFIRVADRDGPVGGGDVLRLAREHAATLDAAMLSRAAAIAAAWRDEFGRRVPRVHVNVAASSLASPTFTELVGDVLADQRLRPSAFAFETETTEVAPIGGNEISTLNALREQGAAVVLDGFGVGPATLQLIEQLRPSMVKIESMHGTDPAQMNDRIVIALARAVASLGVSTAVKRIETPELLERLVGSGTFAGQGNALHPVTDVIDLRPNVRPGPTLGF